MTDTSQVATASAPVDPVRLLEEAFNNLSLGIVVFDHRREVVFCNKRYLEIYGLSAEQVKPGTPTGDLIRHRLRLGLKEQPEDYIRERVGKPVAQHKPRAAAAKAMKALAAEVLGRIEARSVPGNRGAA